MSKLLWRFCSVCRAPVQVTVEMAVAVAQNKGLAWYCQRHNPSSSQCDCDDEDEEDGSTLLNLNNSH